MRSLPLLAVIGCLVSTFGLVSCAGSGNGAPSSTANASASYWNAGMTKIEREIEHLEAEQKADEASVRAGTMSRSKFLSRLDERIAAYDRLEREIDSFSRSWEAAKSQRNGSRNGTSSFSLGQSSWDRGGNASLASRSYGLGNSTSSSSSGRSIWDRDRDDSPSFASTSRSRSKSRWPSEIRESDYRTGRSLSGLQTTNRHTGRTTTFDRTLGGSYRATSDSGHTTTWEQNLGGGYTGRDSRGTSWQTSETLGGNKRVTGSNGASYTREQMLDGSYKWVRD